MKLSKDLMRKIERDAVTVLKRRDLRKTKPNIYLHVEELPAKKRLRSPLKDIQIPRKSALVFADLAPEYNWGHPCKHILYDTNTGKPYKEIDGEFPPKDFFKEPKKFKPIKRPQKRVDVVKKRRIKARKIEPLKVRYVTGIKHFLLKFIGNRYAILFAGMAHNRHTNDLEFLYRTLVDIYNYDPANIYVLNYDGTINYQDPPDEGIENWPGDDTAYQMPVNDQGSKTALEATFDDLATKLKSNDTLFIHTNNHGGGPPNEDEATLCCFPDWDAMTVTEFAAKLAELPKFLSLIVMMEQCHSGGFQQPIIDNSPATHTHFAAACEEDRSSIGGPDFDPFALDWIAAVTGQYPDEDGLEQEVDTSADGRISVFEAYVYANDVKHAFDTPVSDDKPNDCGKKLFL